MAPKGQRFTQIPQPMQRSSEINAILEAGVTSIHSLPIIIPCCHNFLHSCLHFFGLHLSLLTMATRVSS
ncbi:hypothetical protein BCR41DRAFT_308075 [Lobosporangium transversale]|uniref:Uncharacterized protein n=1 Tax=Lobosporangium transversale TaxID=64571 RepID=A0A1Y2GIX3_9FUNG|nr:hypothetical protein BCR41DRAFT_308075 [Lobosporangium transversale]ORZ12165.1 hypothetical protein BCR41DRAFT_308075 [Lobosporangium transversale]|eukprot:XP_021880030.1 hypothetical protein BCR41DRAFT_308075 [Lobosporangium transversale]